MIETKKGNTENCTPQSQNKDSKRQAQIKTIFAFLQNNVATASMIAEATGIPQKCITRYKRDLELSNRLWEVNQGYCQLTGHLAYYLTTDPSKAPNDNQLNLF